MIVVTKLNGHQFAVNPDLLVKVERTPDTMLTFIDGTKQFVRESIEELSALIVQYRARVAAATVSMSESAPAGNPAAGTVTELRARKGDR